jgi:F0F1-type ATP synthase alpha subunit
MEEQETGNFEIKTFFIKNMADAPATWQYLAPYTGTSLAEFLHV